MSLLHGEIAVAALEGKARPGKVEARHEAQPRVDGTRDRLAVARASAAAEGKGAEPGGGFCLCCRERRTSRRCRCYLLWPLRRLELNRVRLVFASAEKAWLDS